MPKIPPIHMLTRDIIKPILKKALEAGKPPLPMLEASREKCNTLFDQLNMRPDFGIGRRAMQLRWNEPGLVPDSRYVLLTHVKFDKYEISKGSAHGVFFEHGIPTDVSPQLLDSTGNKAWKIFPQVPGDAELVEKYQKFKLIRDQELREEAKERLRVNAGKLRAKKLLKVKIRLFKRKMRFGKIGKGKN